MFYFISGDHSLNFLISLICVILQACLVCPTGNTKTKADIFSSENFLLLPILHVLKSTLDLNKSFEPYASRSHLCACA